MNKEAHGLGDIDEWINISAGRATLDGSFTADELRRIADAIEKDITCRNTTQLIQD